MARGFRVGIWDDLRVSFYYPFNWVVQPAVATTAAFTTYKDLSPALNDWQQAPTTSSAYWYQGHHTTPMALPRQPKPFQPYTLIDDGHMVTTGAGSVILYPPPSTTQAAVSLTGVEFSFSFWYMMPYIPAGPRLRHPRALERSPAPTSPKWPGG